MKVIPKRTIGNLAEEKACQFLLAKGLILIARNFYCRCGEIDLIMRDRDDIVFIEIRSRVSSHFGNAIESIDKTKQKKLIRSAKFYLQQRNWYDKVNCRFDVVGLSTSGCEWIKNAFLMDEF